MNIQAVIPAKSFETGKSKLAGVLGDRERAALNRRFFERTLGVVREVFLPGRITVVSPSEEVLGLAAGAGARGLLEGEPLGLNHALDLASEDARKAGADAVLCISCDLPYLAAADLQAMIDAARGPTGVIVAGDRHGVGTNAILVAPPRVIAFRYGEQSLAAHLGQAAENGIAAERVIRPGLAFDVDTPGDLAYYRSTRHAPDLSANAPTRTRPLPNDLT